MKKTGLSVNHISQLETRDSQTRSQFLENNEPTSYLGFFPTASMEQNKAGEML